MNNKYGNGNEIKWSNDLNRQKVYIDKEILTSVMRALGMTNDVVEAYADNGAGSRTKKVHEYESVKDIADVLGLPAWILLTEREEDNIIRQSHEENDRVLKPHTISSLADMLSSVENDFHDVKLSRAARSDLNKKLAFIWGVLDKNHDWSVLWDEIYSWIKKETTEDEFHCAFKLIFVKGYEVTHRATLRVMKRGVVKNSAFRSESKRRKFENKKIINSWLMLESVGVQGEKPNLLSKILLDLSELSGNTYKPNLVLEEIDKYILFSWHNMYEGESVEIDPLKIVYKKKIKKYNAVSKEVLFMFQDYFYYDQSYHDPNTLKVSKNDDLQLVANKLTDELKADHQLNTLEFLAKRGYLKNGTRLVFKYKNKYTHFQSFPRNDPFWFATVVDNEDTMVVRWEHDLGLYHLTPLSNKIFDMIKHGYNIKQGTKYWSLEDNDQDLYSLSSFLKKREIENDGHMMLF